MNVLKLLSFILIFNELPSTASFIKETLIIQPILKKINSLINKPFRKLVLFSRTKLLQKFISLFVHMVDETISKNSTLQDI